MKDQTQIKKHQTTTPNKHNTQQIKQHRTNNNICGDIKHVNGKIERRRKPGRSPAYWSGEESSGWNEDVRDGKGVSIDICER